MNQEKKKTKKEEENQPSIENSVTPMPTSLSKDTGTHQSRSRSIKRKTPPSPSCNEKQKDIERKKLFSPAQSPIRMEDTEVPEKEYWATMVE